MVTEFDIRREMARIEELLCTPMRKARLLLRLARRVRHGTIRLARLSYSLLQDSQLEQAARIQSAVLRLSAVHDEIRQRARELLRSNKPVGFGYAPRAAMQGAWSSPSLN